MKTRLTLMLCACVAVFGLFTFAHIDDPIDRLVTQLQTWTNKHPQEKIYLHTDRPYYLVGDTIWFKAYVTTGSKHQLSAISGAMYVDMINEGDSVALSMKLPITSGMAVGNLTLPDSIIREGNYRIRAYTQWMRNTGPEFFYDRTFTIGNAISNKVLAKIDYLYKKVGDKTQVSALLTYTDTHGVPYANKRVFYRLKEGYNVISSGGGNTNAAGEVSINLPNAKPGILRNSYLLTGLTVANNDVVPKTFPIKTAALQTDVQFFPEGGNLVNGVKSRVAFKATGTNGLGAAISGVVTDNNDKEVARLEVKHLGMGYFLLTPETGKTYRAKVIYADGSTNTVNLPVATDDGYALAVFPTLKTDSIMVRVDAGKNALQAGAQTLSVIGQMGGTPYFTAKVTVSKAGNILLFPIKEVPSGIMQFTLFSPAGVPLNERVTFIQNHDAINVKINTAKKVYNTREKVDLDITANDDTGAPIGGNFSVAVISEAAVNSDEANETSIFSQLLLTADIKGYIEKPNYYFHNQNNDTRASLDVLMLTQGYRRFTWKSLPEIVAASPAFSAEKLANQITGRLTTLGNKPVAGGRVLLANNKLKVVLDTVTDANGRFTFNNLFITNGIEFTAQGRTAGNGKRVNIKLDKPDAPPIMANYNIGDANANIPQLLTSSIKQNDQLEQAFTRQGKLSDLHQLREIKINRAKKVGFGGGISENEADEVYRPDSRQPCATLRECLEEMYKGRVRFSKEGSDCGYIWIPRGYIVTVNGQFIEPCDYQSLLEDTPENISKIYIVRESASVITRMVGANNLFRTGGKPTAVIGIFTKRPNWRDGFDPSITTYDPKGYDLTKEFYSPKYDNPEAGKRTGDIRTTIYWNPRVLTRAAGSTSVSFYNSDRTGSYRVTVEGIDAEGRLGRQVYRYEVKD